MQNTEDIQAQLNRVEMKVDRLLEENAKLTGFVDMVISGLLSASNSGGLPGMMVKQMMPADIMSMMASRNGG